MTPSRRRNREGFSNDSVAAQFCTAIRALGDHAHVTVRAKRGLSTSTPTTPTTPPASSSFRGVPMSRFVLLLFVLLAIVGPSIPEAGDCGGPCPGTLPAIWPDRSAPLGDTVTIYGWNLTPETTYLVTVVDPENGVATAPVVTDQEGSLFGQPFTYIVGDRAVGEYAVRLDGADWNGDLGVPALATTTFQNVFGRQ
jgi:hypothetical protein